MAGVWEQGALRGQVGKLSPNPGISTREAGRHPVYGNPGWTASLQRKVKTLILAHLTRINSLCSSQERSSAEPSSLLVAEFQHPLRADWSTPSLPARVVKSLGAQRGSTLFWQPV